MAKLPDPSIDASERNVFTQIGSLPLWQAVLAGLPLVLIFLGGLIGGLLGGLGTAINVKIARGGLAPFLKGLSMAGVLLGAVIIDVCIVVVLEATL
ncbi:hypothetical protein ACFV0T_24570 [Streptomyces sp. NPDC059582]|uniref:hypothetical protein n=1 Tax=Streptomyces sp. NPDC059582 TaxID=3346875 RepID=UPI003693A815